MKTKGKLLAVDLVLEITLRKISKLVKYIGSASSLQSFLSWNDRYYISLLG